MSVFSPPATLPGVYRFRRVLIGVVILALLPFAVACVSGANPEGWAPPTESGETLFISRSPGKLSAATITDAGIRVRWTFPNDNRADEKRLEPEGIYAAPIILADRTYVATHAEGVVALQTADGTIAWRRDDLGDTIVGAFLALPGDRLAVGTSDGRLHVINAADGNPAPGWPIEGRQLPAGIWASLVADTSTLYAATMKGEVYAINLETGQDRWPAPFKTDGAILELDLLPNGQLFVPSLERSVHLLDTETGRSMADVPTQDWVWMRPAVADGVAYFGDLAGIVYALDITTGTYRWKVPASPDDGFAAFHRIKSQPLVINGVLVIADRAPAVHFLETATGRRLNRVPIEGKATVRAPLVADGATALVLTTKGGLFRADPALLSVTEIPIGGEN